MKQLFYLSIGICVATACSSSNETLVPSAVDSTMPLSLAAADSISKVTRADMKGLHTAGPWENNDQFSVSALYYYSNTTSLGQQFLNEQPVTALVSTNTWDNASSTLWTYSPVKYWPQEGYLDFYAAYPTDYAKNNMDRVRYYHENLGDTVLQTRFYLDEPKGMTVTQLPAEKRFTYTDGNGSHYVENDTTYHDAEEQWDLMFSHRPHLSKPNVTSSVSFVFGHAEMAVRFWTKSVYDGNLSSLVIKRISLNNIHTGGTITGLDITDWQAYYNEFPNYASSGNAVSTVDATTPVKMEYTWQWGHEMATPDIRDTYTQTMDFVWVGTLPGTGNFGTAPANTQINTGNKVFIIPPQCLSTESGASITIEYTTCDLGTEFAYHKGTFNVPICGEPGKVLDIYLSINQVPTTSVYAIEVVTATLLPWENVTGSITTDLEK